jgi:hypothetical protein
MAKLRIGLTIAGAVSLGSYEGGALAALLTAVQAMGPEAVVIDAITGASAGAITAVLAAQCLLRGLQPIEAMKASWVDLPSLSRLATHDMGSPLSAKVLAEEAKKLLATGGVPGGAPMQPDNIDLAITITTLGGFDYRIVSLMKTTPVDAVTYLDWAEFTLKPDSTDTVYAAAAEAALASAANAVGFPPKLLRRTPEDIAKAVANGVLNPPNPNGTWYTDGGTVNNEPFGRLLDVIGGEDPRANRLLLLVHPSATKPPPVDAWVDPTEQPRWTRTGLRAKKINGAQSIYDDLRRLEKTNTRVVSVEDLARAIEGAVTTSADRDALFDAVRAFVTDYEQRHAVINEVIGRGRPAAARVAVADDVSLVDLLVTALGRASGLEGKHTAKVEIVTPDLDPSQRPSEDLLAGEKLGHFFGFTAERFRRSDFALGYRNMTTFLRDDLPKHGVADEIAAALPTVDAAYNTLDWDRYREGDASFASLTWGEKLRLARLGGHIAHVVERDVRHWNDGLPV